MPGEDRHPEVVREERRPALAHADEVLKAGRGTWKAIAFGGGGYTYYVVHGGTSFGFMSGANWNNNNYFSDVTSYDYGAPLDEAGHPTPKFLAFRKIFAKYATCPAQQISSRLERNATPLLRRRQ